MYVNQYIERVVSEIDMSEGVQFVVNKRGRRRGTRYLIGGSCRCGQQTGLQVLRAAQGRRAERRQDFRCCRRTWCATKCAGRTSSAAGAPGAPASAPAGPPAVPCRHLRRQESIRFLASPRPPKNSYTASRLHIYTPPSSRGATLSRIPSSA